MTESIVTIRLTRNLRYKLTYIKIFEMYLEAHREAEVTELLRSLLQAYQEAIGPLAGYLRHLDVSAQDLELDEKLLAHASGRRDVESQLRFIYDGLRRATSWYKTQLIDRQMTADPELRQLLLNLGELDAAKLWSTETIMALLKIPLKLRDQDYAESSAPEPPSRGEEWHPRLVEDVRRPSWSGSGRPSEPGSRDRGRSTRGSRTSSQPGTDSRTQSRESSYPPAKGGRNRDY